jgi:hypothetical protein
MRNPFFIFVKHAESDGTAVGFTARGRGGRGERLLDSMENKQRRLRAWMSERRKS